MYTFICNVTTDDQLSQKKGLRMQHDSQDIQNDHGEPNLEALGDILPRLLAIYGITVDAQFALVGQLFGAALLGYALLTWTARNAAPSDARGAIVLALFVSDAIAFVIALIAQLRNVVNQVGWSTVAIYLLLALGFGYFQFKKPASE